LRVWWKTNVVVSNQKGTTIIFGFMAQRTTAAKTSTPDFMPPLPAGTEVEERIRERAYELYLARGGEPGRADEDWRLAEEELRGITGCG